MKLLLTALTTLMVFAANSGRAAEPKKEDAQLIEGAWLMTTAELAGQKLPEEIIKNFKLILADGKYTLKSNSPEDRGSITLFPAKTPKAIDVKGTEGPNKGKMFLAIYEMSGDSLKICYDLEGKARPEEFKTKAGTKLFLVTYIREKP
ncbi:TIGR03067 domain-containing protein [Zavarzinella formosa]|uniref:TIGR03067 domain-containing protein n=1 Tax=Zavarzinella formosa TaxID=360055 RepID=UPI0002E39E68|nr:TIGR03067 domain-containing protein [Zavarzinella formosa]